jgi:hypothetical protein
MFQEITRILGLDLRWRLMATFSGYTISIFICDFGHFLFGFGFQFFLIVVICAERLKDLKNQIEYWIQPENKTDKTVEVVQLFYDCN